VVKLALGLEYDGSGFYGWQVQAAVRTVQACVEEALSKIADHPVTVYCAGRTDTGVHARGQVIHIETHSHREARAWVLGTNVNLPRDISILWARPVEDDFHARFSAIGRSYRYLILNRPTRPVCPQITWECRHLDENSMQEAANYLVGEHDFSVYRAQGCQAKNPVRTIYRLDVTRKGSIIVIEIEANAFLYHMVRNIVGVLMAIGRGEASPSWAKDVLDGGKRTHGGITAPAEGLYLTGIRYPAKYSLPQPETVLLPLWVFG
jgi:tRNA pseudouridine38-40 synthase